MSKGDNWYMGKYLQGNLNDKVSGALVKLVTDCDVVESLQNIIKDVPNHTITDMINDIEEYERENKTTKGFNKDYSKQFRVGTLRDMQTVGVAFMYYAENALLGDEVGLGKTVQIAGLCNLLQAEYKAKGKPFRYCFLTEKTSVDQIRKKMIKFTGEYVCMLETGEQAVVERYIKNFKNGNDYSIVGGHSLLNSSEFLIHTSKNPFDLIIVDESSIIKNTTSDIYKNTKALFKFHERKVLLNATPLEQSAEEFYNQLDLLDDEFLMTREKFKSRYCVLKPGIFGYDIAGYKNTDEFKEAISLRYLARTRVELGAKYVGNEYKILLVPQSPEQKRVMKKTTLYQMVNDYPTGVDRNIPFNPETTPKVAALLEILGKIDVSTEKALVYCRFKECQNSIKEVLEDFDYRVAIINGDSKIKDRNEVINKFLTDGYDIIITNVQRGLDLNNCNNVIMYTIDPNPQKMVQFEGRMTREFDVMYKSLYMLVSKGREKKFLEETLKTRVDASTAFSNTGKSMTMDALTNRVNIEEFVLKKEG